MAAAVGLLAIGAAWMAFPAGVAAPILAYTLTDHFPDKGWPLPAFAGCCTVVGFHLTSLSIISSARTADQMIGVIGSDSGDDLIRAVLTSMWAWALAALTALTAWLAQIDGTPYFTWYLFLGSLVFALGRGTSALAYATATFRRFMTK